MDQGPARQRPLQRSKSGCWTCRLRRKKCEEGGPPCNNCKQKGIFCHGYGPKPAWKDRGARERDEAARLLANNGNLHRRSRSEYTSYPAARLTNTCDPSSTETSSVLSERNSDDNRPLTAWSDEATAIVWSSPFSNPLQRDALLSSPELALDGSMPANMFSHMAFISATPAPSSLPEDTWPRTHDNHIGASENLEGYSTGTHMLARSRMTMATECSEAALDMIMHFCQDFRTSQQSTEQCGWLLFLLQQSPAFYCTSVAIGAFLRLSDPGVSAEYRRANLATFDQYQCQAQKLCGPLISGKGLAFRGEGTICALHLARLDAMCDRWQESEMNFDAAIRRFCIEEKDAFTTGTSASVAFESAILSNARNAFYAILIWNELFSCCIERRISRAEEIWSRPLPAGYFAVAFEEIVGCQAWAASLAAKVIKLDVWKYEQESQGRLSVRELVMRANDLENEVEIGIKRLDDDLTNQSLGINPETGKVGGHLHTLIFLFATLVQIQTVVSGQCTGVPETQRAINRAIDTWRLRLSDLQKTSARCLAWSFLATASLASDAQRQFFRQFLVGSQLGKQRRLQLIVEECWDAYDRNDNLRHGRNDWRQLVKESGRCILFH